MIIFYFFYTCGILSIDIQKTISKSLHLPLKKIEKGGSNAKACANKMRE